MLYVTMTDKCLSNWGQSKGKTNKLVFECKDQAEAEIVRNNADNRTDMQYVNICTSPPYYATKRYLTQYKTKEDYPSWYKQDYFN